MRTLLVLAAASLVGFASADRLITVPTGKKVPFGSFRFDFLSEVSRSRYLDYYLAAGVTPEFEVAYHAERFNGGDVRSTADITYNYVAPITDIGPGFSAGVLDTLNRTHDGRRVYFAVTFREGLEGTMGNVPMEVTLGLMQGHQTKPFFGIMFPLKEDLHLLVEHDGYHGAAGMELTPWKGLNLRLVFREQNTILGATYTRRF